MADTREWTAEQRQCLDAAGTVLVSAAAGSGKTAVLVERVTRLITDPVTPVDVDSLLVVTFTKAAAAEMKQRLTRSLTERLKEEPHNARLRRQLMLLPNASISTVHSFCGDLIREHFHLLDGVSPRFRVAEESETAPLRAQAMDEILNEAYAAHDPDFERLAAMLGGRRDDRQLAGRIEQLFDFVEADPFPERWLASQEAAWHTLLPVDDTLCGQELIRTAHNALDECVQFCAQALRLCDKADWLGGYAAVIAQDQAAYQRLDDILDTLSWDERLAAVGHLSFDRMPQVRNCPDPILKEQIQALRKKAKEKAEKLPELFVAEESVIQKVTADLAPVVGKLCALVRAFTARYAEKKQQKDLLDFDDLEHFALRLLAEPEEDGGWHRTPLAREVAARFSHVMVDEYQDTNPTQECLFSAVSDGERNLFFVGDIKQSIYSFRNATPGQFIARRDRYPAFDGVTYPAAIRLGHNFRSRKSVTETVNLIFSQLMTAAVCGVDYDDGEQLVARADYPPHEDDAADLLLVDTADSDREDITEVAEARVIATRIRELLGTPVKDKEGERACRFGDICILLRSTKGHAAFYADELNRLGIPAQSGTGNGFFTSPEVGCALSLLRFLDNPLQDISLLAVLLSPLFAFTPDDMAALREADRHAPLFVALRRRARREDALAARCTDFLKSTERLRTLAAVLPADRLLSQIYEETALPAVMGARRGGEQRTANLQKLLDMAHGFEQNGYRGLSAFLHFIDSESERSGGDVPAPVSGGTDVVHILSIHASKGLEYPVVFLAGMHRFNDQSATGALLLHRELGMGLEWHDTETGDHFAGLQKRALAQRIRRDERAESLRILYVALTRARERLCLVISGDIKKMAAAAAALVPDTPHLSAGAVIGVNSFAEWLLMALMRHPDACFLRALAGADALEPLPCEERLHILMTAPPDAAAADTAAAQDVPADEEWLQALDTRLAYQYPYAALGSVPAKMAASVLAHKGLSESFVATARPAFLGESTLSPAERGTAMHQFMQFARYEAAAADPAAEVRRLVEGGYLSPAQGNSLSLPRLAAFFGSDLYRRIQRSPDVRREYAFAVERPVTFCTDLPPETAGDEQVLIQGIADCVFAEGDGYVIVDYKTDRVSTPQELADRYRAQLALYADALEPELGAPVRERLLYSFALQRVIPV